MRQALRYRAAMNSMSITYEKVCSQNQRFYSLSLYKVSQRYVYRVYKGILRCSLDSLFRGRSVHMSADEWIFRVSDSLPWDTCVPKGSRSPALTPMGAKRESKPGADTNWCRKRRCMALCVFISGSGTRIPGLSPAALSGAFSWPWWWAQLCPIGHRLPE